MRLFALETSTERLSLALQVDERRFERDIDAGQRHSELALPLIRDLLDEGGIQINELDAIAFGKGPGSFTGVRIACGLAQGLSLGSGVGLLPIETQMTLAERAAADRVLVALDARMNEIYLAAYQRDASAETGWRHVVAPMLVAGDALPPLEGSGWTLSGSATANPALQAALNAAYHAQLDRIDPAGMPGADALVAIAHRIMTAKGESALVAARDAAPLYLRDRVAQTVAERAAAKAVHA